MLRAPYRRAGQCDFALRIRVALFVYVVYRAGEGGNFRFFIPNSDENEARHGCANGYFYLRWIDPHCADLDAMQKNPLILRCPQRDGAVNPRAGIPAGIGLVAVADDDLQGIFLVFQRFPRQIHGKAGIAIRMDCQKSPVERHLGVVIDPFKF